jgi:hypothetical protein
LLSVQFSLLMLKIWIKNEKLIILYTLRFIVADHGFVSVCPFQGNIKTSFVIIYGLNESGRKRGGMGRREWEEKKRKL